MPAYTNHHDRSDEQLRRLAQADPYVMHLVLRQPAGLTAERALIDAARATCACMAAPFAGWQPWADNFAAWLDRGFRKVALRAKNGPFERIKSELDCVVISDSELGDTVMALPPRTKSQQEPVLRKLQAYSPPVDRTPAPGTAPDPQAMLYVLNAEQPMTVGKAMAQVGHAVLICLQAYGPQPQWVHAGRPGAVRVADAGLWQRLKADTDCVVVRDAGLTEVQSGSETVICLPPGQRPAWVDALAALAA